MFWYVLNLINYNDYIDMGIMIIKNQTLVLKFLDLLEYRAQ